MRRGATRVIIPPGTGLLLQCVHAAQHESRERLPETSVQRSSAFSRPAFGARSRSMPPSFAQARIRSKRRNSDTPGNVATCCNTPRYASTSVLARRKRLNCGSISTRSPPSAAHYVGAGVQHLQQAVRPQPTHRFHGAGLPQHQLVVLLLQRGLQQRQHFLRRHATAASDGDAELHLRYRRLQCRGHPPGEGSLRLTGGRCAGHGDRADRRRRTDSQYIDLAAGIDRRGYLRQRPIRGDELIGRATSSRQYRCQPAMTPAVQG